MAALATIISPDWCVISAAIEKAQRSRAIKEPAILWIVFMRCPI
jgi:hypothetical protein